MHVVEGAVISRNHSNRPDTYVSKTVGTCFRLIVDMQRECECEFEFECECGRVPVNTGLMK